MLILRRGVVFRIAVHRVYREREGIALKRPQCTIALASRFAEVSLLILPRKRPGAPAPNDEYF